MNQPCIVVADDEPRIRDLVCEVLEEAGYRVHAVGDGLSALRATIELSPVAALLDVAMPVMTGDEALRELRAAGVRIPVILMTAGTNPHRFLQGGAAAVLPKPFELARLLQVIAQAAGVAQPARFGLGGGQDAGRPRTSP